MTSQQDQMIAIAMPGALEGVFLGASFAQRAQVSRSEPQASEGHQVGERRPSGTGPESGAGAVVAAPHPLYGGSMDSPVVAELCFACRRAGYATVRFNWRGVGASGGAPSGDPASADADYAAALAYLEETVDGPILAAGYSFGAAAAVRVARANPRVRRLLLVAPPPALLDAAALAQFRGSALIVVGSHDSFAPSAELAQLLGDGARRRLEVIPDADHFFMSCGLGDISPIAREWLEDGGLRPSG